MAFATLFPQARRQERGAMGGHGNKAPPLSGGAFGAERQARAVLGYSLELAKEVRNGVIANEGSPDGGKRRRGCSFF